MRSREYDRGEDGRPFVGAAIKTNNAFTALSCCAELLRRFGKLGDYARLISSLFLTLLQALKRFFGERFRFLKFRVLVICSTDADRDECISL